MPTTTWRLLGDHLVTTWWYRKQPAGNYHFAKVTSSEVFSWNLWPMCWRGPESLSSDCQCQLVCPVATWIMAGCTDSQPSMFIPVCYNLLDARYKSDPGELSWFSALCGHLSLNSLIPIALVIIVDVVTVIIMTIIIIINFIIVVVTMTLTNKIDMLMWNNTDYHLRDEIFIIIHFVLDSAAVSVFVNSSSITTNIETAVLSILSKILEKILKRNS